MNPHEHEWAERKRPVKGGVRTEFLCKTCGVTRGMQPQHEHAWHLSRERDSRTGAYRITRHCMGCGETQTRNENALDDWGSLPVHAALDPAALETHRNTVVGQHGGIIGYDPATEVVSTGDGSSFSIESLAEANPGVPHQEIHRALVARFPGPRKRAGGLSARELAALRSISETTTASTDELVKAFEKFATAAGKIGAVSGNPDTGPEPWRRPSKRWTSDDALTLILEEIKRDPDPLKAAGKWITKMTNAITDITRNLDDDR